METPFRDLLLDERKSENRAKRQPADTFSAKGGLGCTCCAPNALARSSCVAARANLLPSPTAPSEKPGRRVTLVPAAGPHVVWVTRAFTALAPSNPNRHMTPCAVALRNSTILRRVWDALVTARVTHACRNTAPSRRAALTPTVNGALTALPGADQSCTPIIDRPGVPSCSAQHSSQFSSSLWEA